MDIATSAAVVSGLVAVVGAVLTYRASAQANKISDKKVDAEAYDRAQGLYEKTLAQAERQLDQAEKQIGQLRETVNRLEVQVRDERDVSDRLRVEVSKLRRIVDTMERHMARMRAQMRAAGLAVPEEPSDSSSDAV